MPKRFTDTDKWKDEWYISLDNDSRIVWQYLLDNCTIAGIFKKNLRLMNFCCNTNYDEKKLNEIFENRIFDCDEYYFIPKFLQFQYPQGLISLKPAIISIRNELITRCEKNKKLKIILKSLSNDYRIIKDKDKDIDKDKDTDNVLESEKFSPPFILQVESWLKENGRYIPYEAEQFINYYTANGWTVKTPKGKKPMENWKHAINNWSKNFKKERSSEIKIPKPQINQNDIPENIRHL